MRILFVAPRFHTNQVPLVLALRRAGHDVLFDVLFEGPTEDRFALSPTVVEPARLSRWLELRRNPSNLAADRADHAFPALLAYWRRLRALKPDAVIVRDPIRPFSWRAALAARLLGVPLVLYTQGVVHGNATRRRDVLRSVVMRLLDAPWYSPVSGDPRLPKLHPDLHYLPFAADLDRAVKSEWFLDGRVNILCIGKFTERKNHLLMVDAFDRLRRRFDVRLTLVGERSTSEHGRYHDAVVARIDALGLREQIAVRTNVMFADMADLYRTHDVFVLPSRNEPAGVSILEAMSHGLPVVCSTTSGTRWYVEPGASGHVFASDDLSDLVAKLETMLESREALVRMGNRARSLAETKHHPDRIRDGLLALIEGRVRRRSARSQPEPS